MVGLIERTSFKAAVDMLKSDKGISSEDFMIVMGNSMLKVYKFSEELKKLRDGFPKDLRKGIPKGLILEVIGMLDQNLSVKLKIDHSEQHEEWERFQQDPASYEFTDSTMTIETATFFERGRIDHSSSKDLTITETGVLKTFAAVALAIYTSTFPPKLKMKLKTTWTSSDSLRESDMAYQMQCKIVFHFKKEDDSQNGQRKFYPRNEESATRERVLNSRV